MTNNAKYYKGLILTHNPELITLFENSANGLNLVFESDHEISDYLIKLWDNGFSLIVFDCAHLEQESLKWIKIIRRMRPKLPLIVISNDFDPQIGGELYDEGTFFYQQQPVNEKILSEVLNGALNISQTGFFNEY